MFDRITSALPLKTTPLVSPGVCQRDCTSYYSFLEEESGRIGALLEDFFAAEVCKKFPDPDCEYVSCSEFCNVE